MPMLGQVSLNTWKTMIHNDFDLCCNEECPKRHECKRYVTYKQDRWLFNYVMKGCIDGTLFIKEK